jgi:hypothetical protein
MDAWIVPQNIDETSFLLTTCEEKKPPGEKLARIIL